jgi:hypothetical protein
VKKGERECVCVCVCVCRVRANQLTMFVNVEGTSFLWRAATGTYNYCVVVLDDVWVLNIAQDVDLRWKRSARPVSRRHQQAARHRLHAML